MPKAALVIALSSLLAAPAIHAQTQPSRSPILIIDQDRLFSETRLGERSAAAIEAEARELAEENRRIEEELRQEELKLTKDRVGLTPEEFSELADGFDEKVQALRAQQDAKARALSAKQEEARQRFFVEIGGILSEIVQERGADVVFDQRDVFLSADRVDITDEVIRRINARPTENPTPANGDDAEDR